MLRMRVRLLLLFMVTNVCNSHEGMEYLQSAISDLRNMNYVSKNRRIDTLRAMPLTKDDDKDDIKMNNHPQSVPPLSLTKGELVELYESAINNGKTIKLDTGHGGIINAAVHEIDSSPDDHDHESNQDDSSSYYYYYYPLKSFINQVTSTNEDQEHGSDQHYENHYDPIPHNNDHLSHYHSHTHKHTLIIPDHKTDVHHGYEKHPKPLEPLFMAISGFIGMAVMFVLSALVLPKFSILKTRGGKQQFGNEVYSITGIVLKAIEGKQCSEKLACEMGKTADAYNIYNNRFVKFLRRFAPALIAKQIEKVGKYTDKKYKCAAIQCKRKNVPSKPKSEKKHNKT